MLLLQKSLQTFLHCTKSLLDGTHAIHQTVALLGGLASRSRQPCLVAELVVSCLQQSRKEGQGPNSLAARNSKIILSFSSASSGPAVFQTLLQKT